MQADDVDQVEQMRATLATISYITTSALMDLAAVHDDGDDLDSASRETTGLGIVAVVIQSIFPRSGAAAVAVVGPALRAAAESITTRTADASTAASTAVAHVRAAWIVLELLPHEPAKPPAAPAYWR